MMIKWWKGELIMWAGAYRWKLPACPVFQTNLKEERFMNSRKVSNHIYLPIRLIFLYFFYFFYFFLNCCFFLLLPPVAHARAPYSVVIKTFADHYCSERSLVRISSRDKIYMWHLFTGLTVLAQMVTILISVVGQDSYLYSVRFWWLQSRRSHVTMSCNFPHTASSRDIWDISEITS